MRPVLGLDLGDRGVDGLLGVHVHLDGAQVDVVLGRVVRCGSDLGCVAAGGFAHAGVDGVAGVGEGAGGEGAEAAGGAGDDDDVAHGDSLR